MPGAISLAATHPGKIKNIMQSARSETSGPAEACILELLTTMIVPCRKWQPLKVSILMCLTT